MNNRNGKYLQKFLDDEEVIILNDGTPTRITPPSTTSAPDVALATTPVSIVTDFKVLNDAANSDHFPIYIDINNNEQTIKSIIKKKRI